MKSQMSEPTNQSQKHGMMASRDQNTTLEVAYRLVWLHANRWNFLIAFLTLGIIIPLIIGSVSRNHPYRQNTSHTPAYQGQAYVASKTAFSTNTKDPVTYYITTFRLNGRLIKASTFNRAKWNQTPTDTTIPVTYHAGDNDLVIISDWQPTPVK